MTAICHHRDTELVDPDSPFPIEREVGEICGKPATHYSCNTYPHAVCEGHRCRCPQPGALDRLRPGDRVIVTCVDPFNPPALGGSSRTSNYGAEFLRSRPSGVLVRFRKQGQVVTHFVTRWVRREQVRPDPTGTTLAKLSHEYKERQR